MRGDALLLCMAMALTGCVSLTPASSQGRSLSYTPREATGAASAPDESPSAPRFVTDPEEPVRLHRRKGVREVVTGASPVRMTVALANPGTQVDAWEQLLTDAGLEEGDARPLSGGALTPTQAARLLTVLLGKPVTLGTFPARMAVGLLLREVLAEGEVSREALLRRVERFHRVAVLRPDGHLAWVWNGRTQQRVGAVEWKDGAFRAGPFELGRFYVSNGFVLELADGQLAPVHGPVFVEVYDDADLIGRTLDGAEAAVVKLALALGRFCTYPLDSLAALKDLPAGVTALIASSPEYFERFRYMTRGEQVQAVAELATGLLLTTGTASSATRTVTGVLAGAEATVPVLSLSAQGALTLERVAVPVGRGAASVLGGGPGAAIVLQRVDDAADSADGSGGGSLDPSTSRGPKAYSSFKSFKRAMGPAGEGKEWHHIVEQTVGNEGRFGPKTLHNTENVIALRRDVHSGVSSLYSSKRPRITNSETLTVRQWLSTQSLEAQREFGLMAIQNVMRGIW
ncbi:hypothetical protein D7V97_09760 [Corallococcus sp. CA053C]|uniref:hypothetical protein n=1 Tax=Corallococcus sp. CA053C TaxID=2316732 RepID=UPI000EA17607|nr:hypothetical protein [Corallococcus sp. CA053C]RKH11938.1 hypothetical protein D7V97_09760 [Corallococcus sp. CA053C]